MTAFNRFARRAVMAAVAAAALAAAGSASAEVLMSRSECIGGFWHVVTYDISDPDHWVRVGAPIPTSQPCGDAVAPAVERRVERPVDRPFTGGDYQLRPTYELRPTLRYSLEKPEPAKPARIPLRYAF
jgi:hypothetical protein